MNEIVRLLGLEFCSYNNLKKWRQRGAVPHKYRLRMLEAARKRGLRLTKSDFEFEPTSAKERERQRQQQAA